MFIMRESRAVVKRFSRPKMAQWPNITDMYNHRPGQLPSFYTKIPVLDSLQSIFYL